MPETFFILLAGGIMLAAGVSDPRAVTLAWLRLCGILALSMGGVGLFFLSRRGEAVSVAGWAMGGAVLVAILGQVGFAQMGWRRAQMVCAWVAFFLAVRVGVELVPHEKARSGVEIVSAYASCVGIAAMSGLVLMDMLLGHAYLTASSMTMAPFRRLNGILGGVLVWRALLSVGAVMVIHAYRPVYMLWGAYGLLMLTRWIVGLGVPAVFVYMADDCIKRRSTQSATGILYVAGVLIFIGEIVGLYLVRGTGLPF